MRIAICDDQKMYTDLIRSYVVSWSQEREIKAEIQIATSGEELIEQVRDKIMSGEHIDIVFLDMKMGSLNGIETARRIRRIEPRAYIIFITSHFVEVVFDAFEVRAFRYIMKNKMQELLPKALDDILKDMNEDLENYLEVSFNRIKMWLSLSEVLFFEGNSRTAMAHMTHARSQRFSMKIDDLGERVAEYGFIRCHQSYIVNSVYVRKIKNYTVIVSDGQEIPVSRTKYEQVKKEFAWSLR